MKLLCSSSNLGYLISLDIALQAEGIETFLSDADRMTAGFAGPMASAGRLYVLNEDDLEQAIGIARALASGSDAVPAAQTEAATTAGGGGLPAWTLFAAIVLTVTLISMVLLRSG